MSYIVRSNAALPKGKAWTVNQPVISPADRQVAKIPTRRGEVSWLDADGAVQEKSIVFPSMPVFTNALSAFAQGTLVQTPNGYVAIEDLQPGMKVATGEGPLETIEWIGSMTIIPGSGDMNLGPQKLYRLTDGGYGFDEGTPDLMLGGAARVLPGLMATNSTSPLTDIEDLVDGFSVIEINPVAPITVFHIGLASHRLIRCNGMLAESYHPGSNVRLHLSSEMFKIFMNMFPHMENDGCFGPVVHKRT